MNPDRRPGTAVRDVAEPVEGDRTGQTETTAAAPRRRLRLPTGARSRPLLIGAGLLALLALSVVGVVALRRRRVPLTPLLAVIGAVALTVGFVYGTTRFRAPAEVALVLVGSVGIDAAIRRIGALVHDRRNARMVDEPKASTQAAGVETRALRILRPS